MNTPDAGFAPSLHCAGTVAMSNSEQLVGGAMIDAFARSGFNPRHLRKHRPQLLDALAARWGREAAIDRYFDRLLFSRKDSSEHLPAEIVSELHMIRSIHHAERASHASPEEMLVNGGCASAPPNKVLPLDDFDDAAAQMRAPDAGSLGICREVSTASDLHDALDDRGTRQLPGCSRPRIGELLHAIAGISVSEIEQALSRQRDSHVPRQLLGQILTAASTIRPEDVVRALCVQQGVPCVDPLAVGFGPEVLAILPPAVAQDKNVMPLMLHGRCLVVAAPNPFDDDLRDFLRFFTGRRVQLVFGRESRIAEALGTYGAQQEDKQRSFDKIASRVMEHGTISRTGVDPALNDEDDEIACDARKDDESVIGLVNKFITDAIRQGASDIHIEAFPKDRAARIRFRVDGVMRRYADLPITFIGAVVSRIKIMASLDISEKRRAQDGKISFRDLRHHRTELRVATIPTVRGVEQVTLRVLSSGEPLPLDKIGLSPDNLTRLREQIAKPHGLILVCGPTGSGKTTTLHSALHELNTDERKIWTAEDPVEITQSNISQVQVNAKIGWTFAAALRSFLRADPDVIMIGEMRDGETARIAVEASMTGHLVMSTLHTNSAPETVARLLDLGIDPFNLSDALHAVLAQRLARRVCRKCAEHSAFTDEELGQLADAYLGGNVEVQPDDPQRQELINRWRADFGQNGTLLASRAKGCSHCGQTGYAGRVGIHELLIASPAIGRLVRSRASAEAIAAQAASEGMRTLRQEGIERVLQGLTDFREVLAVCS